MINMPLRSHYRLTRLYEIDLAHPNLPTASFTCPQNVRRNPRGGDV